MKMPFWQKSEENLPPPQHLPLPTGPHAVGYQDVMTPGPAHQGVFVRIYYPSEYPRTETLKQSWLWPLWAEDEYLAGFIKFGQAVLARWPSWAPRGEYMCIDQASYLGPLFHIWGTHVWKLLNGEVHCPILKNAQISQEKKWPLIVFSHGLGCSRFAYSRICTDLASHGFVVAATEHRDGSAGISFTMETGGKKWIPHMRVTEAESEYAIRNHQLHFRVAEVKRTMDLMESLNAREAVTNVLEEADDLNMFENRIEIDNPTLAGHSFGGATTLVSLAQDKRFTQGLVLDGWLFPLKEEMKISPSQPILFINTESFMYKDNIDRIRMFLTDFPDRRMIFIKGSIHSNHMDTPLIFKYGIIKRFVGMHSATDPVLVLDVNDKLMIQFIWKHLGIEVDKDVDQFLEEHESVIVETSEDELKRVNCSVLPHITLGEEAKENVCLETANTDDQQGSVLLDSASDKLKMEEEDIDSFHDVDTDDTDDFADCRS